MSLSTTGPEDSDLSFPSGFSRLTEKLLTLLLLCCAVLLTVKAAQFMLWYIAKDYPLEYREFGVIFRYRPTPPRIQSLLDRPSARGDERVRDNI